MEDLGGLLLRAFDGDFHAAIVLLVCLIGAIIYLFVVYEICYLWKARAAAQSNNPKRREKVKRNGRQEEMNSSSGQTKPSSVTSQETANILQELVEAMPLEQATSNDEGHRVHLVAELFPQPKTLKKMKETKGGVPESGNCSRRHPPQYHAQPAIGASRMAKMSEMQSYLGAANAKYKQQEEELRVIRQRMADLQSRLCNWRVEKAYLLRVKTKITQLLEEAKRIDRELGCRIRDLKEQCKQAKSDVEEKKTLLGTLYPSINAIEQNVASYNRSLISLHEDPVA